MQSLQQEVGTAPPEAPGLHPREAAVRLQVADAKAHLYDEVRSERDQLQKALAEATAERQKAEKECASLRVVAAQADQLSADAARMQSQLHATTVASQTAQAELHIVRRARDAAAGAAQAALDAATAAQDASKEAVRCTNVVKQAQRSTHDALLVEMETLQAEVARLKQALEAAYDGQTEMQEDLVDLRARCILQRRELEDARAALSEYHAGEDALDAALEAAAQRQEGPGDAAILAQASSHTASIRRRTASALQALRRAHSAEQAAARARESLQAEEAKVLRLRSELQVVTERATAVQQPTQSLVHQLMEARQEADQWRTAADAAAVELAAMRSDFRRVLDARVGLDDSLAKALAKIVSAGLSSRPATRPGRRTAPLRR